MNAREGVEALVDAACPDRQARRTIDLFEDTVREQATIAAYRAAADELRVVADEAVMWQASSAYAAAANLLRARANEMEQQ